MRSLSFVSNGTDLNGIDLNQTIVLPFVPPLFFVRLFVRTSTTLQLLRFTPARIDAW